MKHQKRYSSEGEIMALIDASKAKASQLCVDADELEIEARQHAAIASRLSFMNGTKLERAESESGGNEAFHLYKSGDCFQKSKELRKKANRITTVKLPELGKVLSAFRTQPMELITGSDHAVV